MSAERVRIQTGLERLEDGRWRPLVRFTRPGQPPEDVYGVPCATEREAERVARATAAGIRSELR